MSWLRRHVEWVFVVVACVVALSAMIGTDPEAGAGAYIAVTFGTAAVVVGLATVWLMRSGRQDERAVWWVLLLGVPGAVLVASLPDLLAGRMDDDRTGTGTSILLFLVVLAACVPLGMLVGFLVVLPVGLLLRGLAMAVTGRGGGPDTGGGTARGEGVLLVLVAGLPLSVVAAGVAGAIAMDHVPIVPGPVNAIGVGGAAMVFRAFGVHNGVTVENATALVWFRALTGVVGAYLAALAAASTSGRGDRVRPTSPVRRAAG